MIPMEDLKPIDLRKSDSLRLPRDPELAIAAVRFFAGIDAAIVKAAPGERAHAHRLKDLHHDE